MTGYPANRNWLFGTSLPETLIPASNRVSVSPKKAGAEKSLGKGTYCQCLERVALLKGDL